MFLSIIDNVKEKHDSKALRDLLIVLIFSLLILPAILLSINNYADSFSYIQIARAVKAINLEHLLDLEIPIFGSAGIYQGQTVILIFISTFTGIQPYQIQNLPIGALFIIISYYSISKLLFKSTKIAFLFSFYSATDPTVIQGSYSTFLYAWSNLYLLSVILLLLLSTDDSNKENESRFSYFLSFLVITHLFLYWTSTVLILAILVIFFSFKFFSELLKTYINNQDSSKYLKKSLSVSTLIFIGIILLSVAIFIVTGPVSYYIETSLQNISNFFPNTMNFLWSIFENSNQGYQLENFSERNILGYLLAIRYLLLALPIILITGHILIKTMKESNTKHQLVRKLLFLGNRQIIMATVLIAAIIQAIGYGLFGHFSLRYAALLFPFVSVYFVDVLDRIRKKRSVKPAFLIILGLISSTAFFISYSGTYTSSYDKIKPGAIWLSSLEKENSLIFTDMETWGKFLVLGVENGVEFGLVSYNDRLYGEIVNPMMWSNVTSLFSANFYIINIDTIHAPLTSTGWKIFQPLYDKLQIISQHPYLDLIFSDDNVRIFNITHT